MKQLDQLLDCARSASNLASDYALAKKLDLDVTLIYRYRAGRGLPSQDTVILLAEIAGQPVGEWLAWVECQRAHDDKLSRVWKDVAERLAS